MSSVSLSLSILASGIVVAQNVKSFVYNSIHKFTEHTAAQELLGELLGISRYNPDLLELISKAAKDLLAEVFQIASEKYNIPLDSFKAFQRKINSAQEGYQLNQEELALYQVLVKTIHHKIKKADLESESKRRAQIEPTSQEIQNEFPQLTPKEADYYAFLSHLFETKNIIVWSRGGGGHKSAYIGLYERQLEEHPDYAGRTRNVDMVGGIVPSFLLNPGVEAWNNAQIKGDIDKQIALVGLQSVGECFFFIPIFIWTFFTLLMLDKKPEHFVSTQVLGITPMVRAIQLINAIKKWDLKLELYMTDLPTKHATHFFSPCLKSLLKHEDARKVFELHCAPPLATDREAFFVEHLGFYDESIVKIDKDYPYPVRRAFYDVKTLTKKVMADDLVLPLKYNPEKEERDLRELHPEVDSRAFAPGAKRVYYHIRKEDRVGFVMLGSQPTERALLDYISKTAAASVDSDSQNNHNYLFLYVKGPEMAAIKKLVADLKKSGKIAENFTIVPFTYQDSTELAAMMVRSDLLVIRSGGSTIMEVLCIFDHLGLKDARPGRQLIIHSEGLSKLSKKSMKQREETSFQIIGMLHQFVTIDESNEDQNIWAKGIHEILQKAIDKYSPLEIYTLLQKIKKREALIPPCGSLEERKRYRAQSQMPAALHFTSKELNMLQTIEKLVLRKIDESFIYLSEAEREKIIREKMNETKLSKDDAIRILLLETGIPLWEGGNAEYAEIKLGAVISNASYAGAMLSNFFLKV